MRVVKSKEDKKRVLEIFKDAFVESPGITWMTNSNEKKLDALLSYFIDEAFVKNGVYLTTDNNGAVLFFQIQNRKKSLSIILKRIYLILFILGLKKSLQTFKYKKLINSIRPTTGWLGWLVATDQNVEGNKAAYEIKNEMFRISEESKEPIFVETTVKRVRLLYLRAGYQEYHSIKHPFEDLTIYFMKKEPVI